jgi:hypothetical protein
MIQILEKYKKWKIDHPDEDYQCDEIFEFIESRGDLYEVMEFALKAAEYFDKNNLKDVV